MKSNDFVARLRDTLLNETLLWLGVVSLPMVALTLWRIPEMGWRPAAGLQFLFLSMVWLAWFQRRRINYSWRLGIVLFAIGAAGLTGYVQRGPVAVAGPLLLLFLTIAVVFTEGRIAIGLGLLILAGLLLTAWGAVSGALQFPVDYTSYAHHPLSWLLIILAFAGYGGIVALLVWRLFRGLTGHQQQLMQINAELAVRTGALAESVRFAQTTMDALTANLAILDENGTIITVNRSWRQFARDNGAEPGRVCDGMNYLAVCDAAAGANLTGAAEMAAGIRSVLQGARDEFVLELPCDSPAKARRFLGRVTRFPGAGAARALVTHEDVTALMASAIEVRKLARAVEQSPAAVVITDRGGRIEYVNPQFEEISGYAMAELLGRNPRILKSGWTSADTYREMWGAISAGGRWRGELRNRKKSGELYWEDASMSGLRDESGKITHFIGVKADITSSKQAVEALREIRQREVAIGASIQRSLLSEVPAEIEGAQLAAYADPSQIVDGDFYSVRRYRPDCFEVLAGDVMGKGVPAALMGAGIITAYNRALADLLVGAAGARSLPTPAEIVNAIHRELTPQMIALSSFATLTLYRFDLAAGTLTWVNAGHTPGLLTRGAGARPVAITGENLPIGVMPDEVYVQSSLAVWPGDSLLIFSDGITEARSPEGEEFGLERLSGLIETGSRANLPPAAMLHALRGEQRRFTGGGPGADDLTALMVGLHPRRRAPRGRIEDRVEPFVFTLPWTLEGLGALRARIAECAAGSLPAEDADALILASFEAATNVIRYSRLLVGDATLTCRISRESDALAVELIYPSAVFALPAEVRPDLSGESEGGFGLFIIEQSVDSVEYASPMPGIASIRLVKRAGAASA